MQKLKNRLDAFSDAIIAIIITIMILDVPPVLHDTAANYLQLGKSLGIYLISFIFIANMWYQHGTVFGEIETMTYRIIILDMGFLALLSLMPLFTNMMANNTTTVTVMLYGLTQFLVNWSFRLLTKAIVHLEYPDRGAMRQVYAKIYGNRNRALTMLSILAWVTAYFYPRAALVFYLLYPVLMFLLNSTARQQMYDIENLPPDQQKDFSQLNAADRRAFLAAQAAIMNPKATSQQAAPPTTNWADWLDQNVDAKRRQLIRERFANTTPEQRAQMAQWFANRAKAANRK